MAKILITIYVLMFLTGFGAQSAVAQSVAELEAEIRARNDDMQNLQSELSKLRSELSVINQKSNTLGNAVSELDTTRKKLLTEIKIAEDKIGRENSSIKILEIEIGDKETSINKAKKAISVGIARMNELDSESITYKILSQKNFSEAVNQTNEIIDFQKSLRENVFQLRQIQQNLSNTITEKEEAKNKLLTYKTEVEGQKKVVEGNKKEKETLLKETKKQETKKKEKKKQRNKEKKKKKKERKKE